MAKPKARHPVELPDVVEDDENESIEREAKVEQDVLDLESQYGTAFDDTL